MDQDIIKEAEKEVERLRQKGWTQADFAAALKKLLEGEEKTDER